MEPVNWSEWKFWLDLVQWLMMMILGVWVFIDKGREKNSTAIDKVVTQQNSLDKRVLSLENKAATHKDVADLRAEMEGMKSTLNKVDQTSTRIHDYLLNKKGSN